MRYRWPLFVLCTSACTLNVASVEHVLSARTEAPFTTIGVDASDADPDLGDVILSVEGSDAAFAVATGRVVGLRAAGQAEAPLLADWYVGFVATGDRTDLVLDAPYDARGLWLASLTLEVPRRTDLLLALGTHSLHATGLSGRLEAVSTAGSMEVDTSGVVDLESTSGSMDIAAAAGNLRAQSGSIRFVVEGWVAASADSGSIEGTMGDGGSLQTRSGSIDVTLAAAPTRDLSIDAGSGSVVLAIPEGVGLTLDVASERGDVVIHAGGFDGEGSVVTELSGGGPLIRIRAATGSIVVTD